MVVSGSFDGFRKLGSSSIGDSEEAWSHNEDESFRDGEMEVFRKEIRRSLSNKEAKSLFEDKGLQAEEASFYCELGEQEPGNAQSNFYFNHLATLTVWQKILKIIPSKLLQIVSLNLLEQQKALEGHNSLESRVFVIANMIKELQKEGLEETSSFRDASALNMALLAHVVNDLSIQNMHNGPSKEKQQLELQDKEAEQRRDISGHESGHETIRRYAILGEAERELSVLQKAAQTKQQQQQQLFDKEGGQRKDVVSEVDKEFSAIQENASYNLSKVFFPPKSRIMGAFLGEKRITEGEEDTVFQEISRARREDKKKVAQQLVQQLPQLERSNRGGITNGMIMSSFDLFTAKKRGLALVKCKQSEQEFRAVLFRNMKQLFATATQEFRTIATSIQTRTLQRIRTSISWINFFMDKGRASIEASQASSVHIIKQVSEIEQDRIKDKDYAVMAGLIPEYNEEREEIDREYSQELQKLQESEKRQATEQQKHNIAAVRVAPVKAIVQKAAAERKEQIAKRKAAIAAAADEPDTPRSSLGRRALGVVTKATLVGAKAATVLALARYGQPMPEGRFGVSITV